MEYSDQNGLLSYCYPPSLAVKPVFKTNLMSLKLHRVRHRVLFLKYNTLIWNSSLPEITLSSFDFARKGTSNKEFSDLPANSDAKADQRLPFSHKTISEFWGIYTVTPPDWSHTGNMHGVIWIFAALIFHKRYFSYARPMIFYVREYIKT